MKLPLLTQTPVVPSNKEVEVGKERKDVSGDHHAARHRRTLEAVDSVSPLSRRETLFRTATRAGQRFAKSPDAAVARIGTRRHRPPRSLSANPAESRILTDGSGLEPETGRSANEPMGTDVQRRKAAGKRNGRVLFQSCLKRPCAALKLQPPKRADHIQKAWPRARVPLFHVKAFKRDVLDHRHARAEVNLAAVPGAKARVIKRFAGDVRRDPAFARTGNVEWTLELQPVAIAPGNPRVDVAPFNAVAVGNLKTVFQRRAAPKS